jgi:DNA-binding NtrC family response regulator
MTYRCAYCELPQKCRRCGKALAAKPIPPLAVLKTLRQAEIEAITEAVEYFGEIKAAAVFLGCTEQGLHVKMHRLGLKRSPRVPQEDMTPWIAEANRHSG